MYTQEFRVSDESLPALLKIADFLLIEPLVEDTIAYLKKILSEQNWLTIWRACQAENVPSGLLDDIVTKCLIENHRDILGFPVLTPDERQELISAMKGYITVFLDSERNLRKFEFLVSVWEFVVGHSHGQQLQEILDKMAPSFDGMIWNLLVDRHQEFISSVIPCLKRHLSPENAIEMWLTCHYWGIPDDENQELEEYRTLCEQFIADNYQKIPMSQEMRKRYEVWPVYSRLLHLVPEEHRQAMVALYNQKRSEGQENLTGGVWPGDNPSSFFKYN